ncbi:MAG TPA: carbonic anhydrase [Cytophagaceae bacterium]|jgi:carbonic anhydrase|nr:carbonic anhydrase [Cytophagaceae bacterium]
MIKSYTKLLNGNKEWAAQQLSKDSMFFEKLTPLQTPEYLWIGCSDSRVPAETITGATPGEIFVHRNIANLVVHTDLNLLSVLEYAVKILKVKHVILCGHYGCGGVKASMDNMAYGYVDNWLRNIKEVYAKNAQEIESIADEEAKVNRMVELNVIEQAKNVCKTKVVQKALAKQSVQVHGWVYGIQDGIIKELINITDRDQVHPIFTYNLEK